MAPNINNPGGVKNDPDEIRDGVVSDATRFPGGFIDQQITESGAPVQIAGQFYIANASFLLELSTSPQADVPGGIAFSPDGTDMYIVAANAQDVVQYSLSSAFDVSTASVSRTFDVSAQSTAPRDIALRPDGTDLYVLDGDTTTIFQYSLSTAFDVSTASFSQSFDVTPQDGQMRGLDITSDGSRFYACGKKNSSVYEYSLSTEFDISTASFTRSFDVSTQETAPQGVTVENGGSRLYIVGGSSDSVHQYDLSTDFNVTTASVIRSFDVSSESTNVRGLIFKPDGSQLYTVGSPDDSVYQYAVGQVVQEVS